jgi:hypothetical protein
MKEGNISIQPALTKILELQLMGKSEEKPERERVLIDSNAINAGSFRLVFMIRYGAH